MNLQTCKHHPNAGRFLATCSGCALELHDIQARNEATTAARTAIATLQGMQHAEIIDAKITNTGHLIAATLQGPQRHTDLPYGIDVFRLATAAETDPEQTDPIAPGTWVLVDQWGAGDDRQHATQWDTARREYTRRIDLAA